MKTSVKLNTVTTSSWRATLSYSSLIPVMPLSTLWPVWMTYTWRNRFLWKSHTTEDSKHTVFYIDRLFPLKSQKCGLLTTFCKPVVSRFCTWWVSWEECIFSAWSRYLSCSFTHLCGRLYFFIYHGRVLWSGKLPNEVGETFSGTSRGGFLFSST